MLTYICMAINMYGKGMLPSSRNCLFIVPGLFTFSLMEKIWYTKWWGEYLGQRERKWDNGEIYV